MSLGIDSSISKIPYGSCCLESFCGRGLAFGFKLGSTLKLTELKENWIDLEIGPDFSSSIVLEVLISLTNMKSKHFMILSDSLLGCHFWLISSGWID